MRLAAWLGFLEAAECQHMCAYLGCGPQGITLPDAHQHPPRCPRWGSQEWSLMDRDQESLLSGGSVGFGDVWDEDGLFDSVGLSFLSMLF